MNEYQVTWERYRSWIMERALKGVSLVFMVIWCVIALGCLAFAVIGGGTMFRLYFLFLGAFAIYRAFFRILVLAKKQYRQLAQSYGKENWTRRIIFGDDGITLSDEEKSTIRFAYSDIVKVREKGNMICLDASDKSVLRLYKDAFVESDWEECKARLDRPDDRTTQ